MSTPESKASEIVVRRLRPEDASVYLAFRHAMLVDSPLAFASSPEDDRHGSDPSIVATQLARAESAILGAWRDERLVSAAGLVREEKLKMRHRAFIWGVWTEPAFRGRGIGERVIRACVDLARSWPGVRIVYLAAGAGQHAAIRLYERVGFVAWGVEPACVLYDGALHDEVHMQLRLD
ncbi:MAG: GNAT family N-acetyltransferase [Phycisphaerales bacterium]|jgi:RimJ/RimL family protein N-acetyltransferase|nr:GNAT family N-acetyltransferase [Phycisphaerales bacterium]